MDNNSIRKPDTQGGMKKLRETIQYVLAAALNVNAGTVYGLLILMCSLSFSRSLVKDYQTGQALKHDYWVIMPGVYLLNAMAFIWIVPTLFHWIAAGLPEINYKRDYNKTLACYLYFFILFKSNIALINPECTTAVLIFGYGCLLQKKYRLPFLKSFAIALLSAAGLVIFLGLYKAFLLLLPQVVK